jgi:hypothetical protein
MWNFSFFFFISFVDCGIGKLQVGRFEKWDDQGQDVTFSTLDPTLTHYSKQVYRVQEAA